MSNASVPAEKLEALANEIDKFWDSDYNAHDAAARIRALLAEAREEGKPLPEISEAQLYEAVRHKSIKDRMDAVSALFARVAPPASAGTEGPEEVDVIVKLIFEEHPSGDEDFAGLGRYIWPERFDALVKAFKARVEGEKK